MRFLTWPGAGSPPISRYGCEIFADNVSPLTLLCKKAVTSHQEPFAPQNAFSIRSSALAETLATSKMNTTNLPFSEWTTKFPNARLYKAMLDRLTDQANIIETGTESYRFRRTLERKKGGKA